MPDTLQTRRNEELWDLIHCWRTALTPEAVDRGMRAIESFIQAEIEGERRELRREVERLRFVLPEPVEPISDYQKGNNSVVDCVLALLTPKDN